VTQVPRSPEAPGRARSLQRRRALGLGVAVCVLLAIVLTARFVAAPPPPRPAEIVLIEGGGDAWLFEQCVFVGSGSEVIELEIVGPGGEEIIQKLPGELRYFNLECSRTVTDDLSLYFWRKLVEDGEVGTARRDLSVVLLDGEGAPIAWWLVSDAWPAAIQYELGEQPTETVLIAAETIVRFASGVPTPTSPPPTSTPTFTPTFTPTPPLPTPTPPLPTPTPPPECVVTVQDRVVDGSETHESCGVLLAGPALGVVSPGDLRLRAADLVVLRNGVSVGSGARLTLELDPTIPPP
jgi:phage tail-like protein